MKLGNLLKKELKELLTPQTIFSMVFTCVLLIFMGNIMSGAMSEAINNSTVNIVDLDCSEFSSQMISKLSDYGADPKVIELQSDDYSAEMNRLDIRSIVVIPKGFGDMVMNGDDPASIDCISIVNGGGLSSSMSSISASSLTESIIKYVREYTETQRYSLSEKQIEMIKSPVITVEYTTANGKTAQMSPEAITGMLMSQSMIAPFAIFFLLLMASQMIMTAISTEKIDKTLETLLSAPVSRTTVLTAKMISALIVALLNATSMIIGFIFYMNGMMGSAMNELTTVALESNTEITSASEGLKALGMSVSAGGMVIFGIELFLTIAIGLSISLILGAMATDVKSVQTLLTPVMMLTMIPFFITMFSNVNTLPPLFRIVMYIIPFTHTYTALSNIMFGNTALLIGGFIYQIVFFIACMYAAVKIFTTDLLFTMNFSADSGKRMFGRKGTK